MGLRIAIDLDEVLVPMLSHLNNHFEKQYNRKPKIPIHKAKEYNFSKIYDISQREAQWLVWSFYNSEEHKKITADEETKRTVELFHKMGHELYVLTARQQYATRATEELIRRNFGDIFTDVVYTNSHSLLGDNISKSSVCQILGIDVLVDDGINNLDGLPDGTRGVLFTGDPRHAWVPEEPNDQPRVLPADLCDILDYT